MMYFATMPINLIHFELLDSYRRSLLVIVNKCADRVKDSNV